MEKTAIEEVPQGEHAQNGKVESLVGVLGGDDLGFEIGLSAPVLAVELESLDSKDPDSGPRATRISGLIPTGCLVWRGRWR